LINSSFEDRNDSSSEILRLASSPLEYDSIDSHQQINRSALSDDSGDLAYSQQVTTPLHQSIAIPSAGEQLDIKVELDLLLASLEQVIPHPPTRLGFASATRTQPNKSSSISGIRSKIIVTDPVTHTQQLLQELNITHEQLTTARTELNVLHQYNQAQVNCIDESMLEVKQLKFQTQQLAQYSKNQVEQVQKMLGSLVKIRTEIVNSLNKFGGYEEIHSMLAQLEATRHTLVIAHEQATTGQSTFYESLQVIQAQVATRSYDSEHKLQQYQESIQRLFQTIATDRLQIAEMSVDMSKKFTDLDGVDAHITTMHTQIIGKSQTLQSRIAEIDRGFAELSRSVQQEQKQFYELTVETIEKADVIRTQLADIIKQIGTDRDSISTLKTEIKFLRQMIDRDIKQQLSEFDLRYQEMLLTWSDFQSRQKNQIVVIEKLSTWLWVVSFSMGILFILFIWILNSLK
jgi:hypothetical protein